jgi:hypothetical protein
MDEAASRPAVIKTIADSLANMKIIAAVALALIFMGFSASLYISRLATKDDVKESIAPVRDTVNRIDGQINTHETRIQLVERWQIRQEEHDRIRDRQLFEIAVKIGATIVPGIQPATPPAAPLVVP